MLGKTVVVLAALLTAPAMATETLYLQGSASQAVKEGSTYSLAQSYRTIKIADPAVIDIIAMSDRKVTIVALGWGESLVTFLDENGAIIKEIDVKVEHPVEIMTPGPRHAASSFYTCRSDGCIFASETRYELPATRNINENR